MHHKSEPASSNSSGSNRVQAFTDDAQTAGETLGPSVDLIVKRAPVISLANIAAASIQILSQRRSIAKRTTNRVRPRATPSTLSHLLADRSPKDPGVGDQLLPGCVGLAGDTKFPKRFLDDSVCLSSCPAFSFELTRFLRSYDFFFLPGGNCSS